MWQPANRDAIPSPEETRRTKESILHMEAELAVAVIKLEQARLLISNLERDLEQQRAWIAPIRRVPFDVLSEIFDVCSREERLAPIVLGAVCRSWRSTILSTPVAWSYINVQNEDDPPVPLAYVSLFVNRSNPCPLHLGVRWPRNRCRCIDDSSDRGSDTTSCECDNVLVIFENTHRIQCLNIPGPWLAEFPTAQFPNLTHLTITGEWITNTKNERISLDISRFPSLWYLDISFYPRLIRCIDFSNCVQHQLRHLCLEVDDEGRWYSLLGFFAGALESLVLAGDFAMRTGQNWTIDCPRLERLIIIEDEMELRHTGTIEAVTPNLAYFEFRSWKYRDLYLSFEGRRSTTAHLRTNCIFSLQDYGDLRILQLSNHPDLLPNVVEQLEKDINICPRLELIEASDHPLAQSIAQRIDERNKRAGSHITLEYSTRWTVKSPGDIYECRGDLPCQDPNEIKSTYYCDWWPNARS